MPDRTLTMNITLYLVRHGETEGAKARRYKGSIDVPLSENGARQIKETSAFIRNNIKQKNSLDDLQPSKPNLSSIYCSPLSRALKSAEIIAEPHELCPIGIPDLRERCFGIWEGMTFNEIKEKYPQEFCAWADNPLKYSPIGGENTIEVRDRAIKALDMILDNHKSASKLVQDSLKSDRGEQPLTTANNVSIAIVAHGGVNRIILCHIMGIPLENIFRIEQDFAAVNIIEFRENYPSVALLNGICNTI